VAVADPALVPGLARHLERPIALADLGCRWGVDPRWAAFGDALRVVGFDADAEECERLRERHADRPGMSFVAAALGARSGPATLHRAAEPACSSLYPPDPELISRRPGLAVTALVGRSEVELVTLDEALARIGSPPIDVLKMDLQGAELDVLQGAGRTLATVRAIAVEVAFNPMYRGQPLFADVDRHLREGGFVLWRLGHLAHYGDDAGASRVDVTDGQFFDDRQVWLTAGGGQLFWADSFYVRRDLAFGLEGRSWEGSLRDACIASAMGFHDLAGSALARAAAEAPEPARAELARALVP
jgi:FkbM family methyltransferase